MLKKRILAIFLTLLINIVYGNIIPINGGTIILLLLFGNYGLLFILLCLLIL